MTMISLKRKKQELLASKVSSLVSDTNENLLRVNLTKFFTDLEAEIQKALLEYYNDTFMLQGQINLILAPIHEKHQEYYELIMHHKLQEFKRAKQSANRIVKREQKRVSLKAAKPVKITANRNNLFGTLKYSEDRLANNTFTATENTLNRVDSNINEILTDGYRSGAGINEVGRQITERFDQLRTWEANRIARTEIHTAQNMGIMSSYESLGVEYTQWITTHDSRVRGLKKGDRADHVKMDREIIPFGEQYSNGLSFPGDTSGPIEEWINCRCSNAPYVMPAGMMAPSFSPFKESDLVPIEVETPTVTEPQPVESMEDAPYQLNNNENSYSNVEISQDAFEQVIAHQSNRATAKIEWGNVVDLESGNLTHATDIKGKRNQVTIPRPGTNKGYGIIHNHPSGAAFSGADIVNTLDYRFQQACFATTEDGIWIARETEQATFSKSNFGITDNSKYKIKAKMDRKSREISTEIYNEKYKDRIANAKTRKEVNAIKKEYQTDKDYRQRYGDWLLEEYGVGKRRDNLIEIEFIPKERFKHVKF